MQKEIHHWKSANLNKDMEIVVYGHYGFALLLFPATTDDNTENEKNGLIEILSPMITKGKCRVFSVSDVMFDSWLNNTKTPEKKSLRHFQYNNYISDEVAPFIFNQCGGAIPIVTCGAAIGGYMAANTYFRRPDIFFGTLAMSATFDITHFTGGYFDENCYYNSPVHYLPNLNDTYWLSFLQSKHHVNILSGSGENEFPGNSSHLDNILHMKGIPHLVDIWGPEWGHDWNTWNAMSKFIIENKF